MGASSISSYSSLPPPQAQQNWEDMNTSVSYFPQNEGKAS
jgi:hypothetical protein